MARNLVLTPEESVRPELVRTAPIVQVVTGIMRGIPKWPQVCKVKVRSVNHDFLLYINSVYI